VAYFQQPTQQWPVRLRRAGRELVRAVERVGIAVRADHRPHGVRDSLVVLSDDVLDEDRHPGPVAEFAGRVTADVHAFGLAVGEHQRERRVVELSIEERRRRVVAVRYGTTLSARRRADDAAEQNGQSPS